MKKRFGTRPGVHLVLFCSEGPPGDNGNNSLDSAQALINEATKIFSSVRVHTPTSLMSLGGYWADRVSDVTERIESDTRYSNQLKWNRHWARIGLFRWKPSLILHELESIQTNPGDIVFYHDPDVVKYPEYLHGVSGWPRFLRARMRFLDVLAFDDNRAPVFSDVKPELIAEYLAGEDSAKLRHIWAGAIAVRKTPQGISFARTWSDHCSIEAVSPFTRLPSPAGYNGNSCDQAVLTVLWNSTNHFDPEILRDVQYLYRSRKIPPPSNVRRGLRKLLRQLLMRRIKS